MTATRTGEWTIIIRNSEVVELLCDGEPPRMAQAMKLEAEVGQPARLIFTITPLSLTIKGDM